MAVKNRDPQRRIRRLLSTQQSQNREWPATPWAYSVAMLAEKNKPAASGSNRPLSENASAAEFDIVRLRGLASRI